MHIDTLKAYVILIHRNLESDHVESACASAENLYNRLIVKDEKITGKPTKV